MNYETTVKEILDSVGGVNNVKGFEHCATRLRLRLKDNSLIDKEKVAKISNCKGYFYNTGQHQFIFGTGLVNQIYEQFKKDTNIEDKIDKDDVYQDLNSAQKIVRIFADILIPLIPALVTTGLLMGIRGLLIELGVEFTTSGLLLFQMLTDTAFAYLPVLIAYSATKKFGGNPVIGIVVGLMMVSPLLPNAWEVAGGKATPLSVNLLGINFNLIGYQGSIFPAILAGFLISKLEKNLRKVVPSMIDLIVTPFLTLTITIFVVLFILGPIVKNMEILIAKSVINLIEMPFGIGYIIFGGLQQALTITGLHHSLGIIEIQLLNNTGENVIQTLTTASMAGQFGAAIGATRLMKDRYTRTNGVSASMSTLFGITEPLLFGINIRSLRIFGSGMIGGAVGGLLTYIIGLKATGMGITFIPGLLLYIGNPILVFQYLLIIFVSFSVGMILVLGQKNQVSKDVNN